MPGSPSGVRRGGWFVPAGTIPRLLAPPGRGAGQGPGQPGAPGRACSLAAGERGWPGARGGGVRATAALSNARPGPTPPRRHILGTHSENPSRVKLGISGGGDTTRPGVRRRELLRATRPPEGATVGRARSVGSSIWEWACPGRTQARARLPWGVLHLPGTGSLASKERERKRVRVELGASK